jgi:hypothetical protein
VQTFWLMFCTFTNAQKALFFLKYDGKVYAGMLSIG